jgi:hypothetical protein
MDNRNMSRSKFQGTDGDKPSGKDSRDAQETIQREAKNLFKYGRSGINFTQLAELRKRVNDSKLVDSIYDEYVRQYEQIVKQASRFAKLIVERYGTDKYPMHKVMEKALKYKAKLNMTEPVFAEFRRLYEKKVEGGLDEPLPYKTAISQTFGENTYGNTSKLDLTEKDYPYLDNILELYAQSRNTYDQVFLQSLAYEDCSAMALSGKYSENKNIPGNHVSALLAAFYLPRIKLIEDHTIFANIGYIVKCKAEGRAIDTRPNFELYWDMVRDPNDQICNVDSVMADIKNRFILQIKTWESVLRLRLGQYYSDTMPGFLQAMDNCRMNMYDTPELLYVRDEGSMLKKFLGAFSLRPTIVTTTPLYGVISSNPYDRTRYAPTLKQIPMINIRFPPMSASNNSSVRLRDAMDQGHWYFENNMLVPKAQSIVYSRDLLIFYANRRYFNSDPAVFVQPFMFSSLPLTTSGFEELNDRPIDFEWMLEVRKEKFYLRSVVCVERTVVGDAKMITGSSAVLVKMRNLEEGIINTAYVHYNPGAVGQKNLNETTSSYDIINPITDLKEYMQPQDVNNAKRSESFHEKVSRSGTIFVYVKHDDAALTLVH